MKRIPSNGRPLRVLVSSQRPEDVPVQFDLKQQRKHQMSDSVATVGNHRVEFSSSLKLQNSHMD